jgi:hypothetical protein
MNAAESKRRWYHLTPDRAIVALLAVECLLWLSYRLGCPTWHKGYAVLTGVATLGVAFLVMLLWFLGSLLCRRRFQFSIRSLFTLVLIVALSFGWLATETKKARQQKELVDQIGKRSVGYDWQHDAKGSASPNAQPPEPIPVRKLVGDDFFSDVDRLTLGGDPFGNASDIDPKQTTDSSLEHIKGFSQIKELNLEATPVTDRGLEHLQGLKQLRRLILDDTQITDTGLAQLAGLGELQVLSLNSTRITDAGVAHLARLKRLQVLSLNYTGITGAGLAHLAELGDLQVLSLNGTGVTDAGLAHLAGLTKLHELSLCNTKITDAGLAHLARMKQLGMVTLYGAIYTADGYRELQQALPNCKIR